MQDMEEYNRASIFGLDQRLQELEVVHSARDGGDGDIDSAGTATRQHSEVKSSVKRLQDQIQELQSHMCQELRPGIHAVIHGLRAWEDLNGMFGSVGGFDETKARWSVKTIDPPPPPPRGGGGVWIKSYNPPPADSVGARAMLMEKVLHGCKDGRGRDHWALAWNSEYRWQH